MFGKKMLRDIVASKAQFISIFFLAFLGVFIYSGMRAEWEGMRVQVNSYYSKTALADSFLYGTDFNTETLAEVRALPGVKNAQLRLELDTIADLPNEPTLRLLISDENRVSRPLVTGGAEFDPQGDGLWLDERFASDHNLRIGDEISLSYGMLSFRLPIRGFIFHPEFVHDVRDNTQLIPDASLFGYACVPASAVPIPGELPYNQIILDIDDSASADQIAELVIEGREATVERDQVGHTGHFSQLLRLGQGDTGWLLAEDRHMAGCQAADHRCCRFGQHRHRDGIDSVVAHQGIEALVDATESIVSGDRFCGLLLEAIEALEVEFDAGQHVRVGEQVSQGREVLAPGPTAGSDEGQIDGSSIHRALSHACQGVNASSATARLR